MRASVTGFVSVLMSSLVAATALPVVAAQRPSPTRTVADRVYSAEQADRGEQRFKASCSSCHTPDSFTGGAFTDRWSGQTLAEVFDFVSNNMPENDPGGLKPDEYASVLAFILRANSFPAGEQDLPADKPGLAQVAIDVPSK